MSIYGFDIPHEKVRPTRDYVLIRIPLPPRRIGNIITPDTWRELGQVSVQVGIITAIGPLAFKYKDDQGLSIHGFTIGDWAVIRWGAGTSFQASRGLVVSGGWRYISSFNDIIGTIDAANMPAKETLEWEEGDDEKLGMVQADFNFGNKR